MPGRISVEELRPAGEHRGGRRVRRRFPGARVAAGERRLEPRDAGGIIDLALDGLLLRLGPCLALSMFVWLPFGQVRELIGLSGLDQLTAQVASLSLNLLLLVPQGFTTSVVCSLVGDALERRDASVAQGVLRGLRRAPGTLVILLLTQLVTLPLVLLCIAPYFLVQWLTWAAVPIFVLEEDGPAERSRLSPRVARSIGRSLRLASGSGSLGRWILLAVVGQLLLASVLELGATALTFPEAREYLRSALGLGGGAAEFALAAAAALFTALAACVRAALMLAFYLDLRVRREGLDLELALSGLERPARLRPSGTEAA